MNEKISLSEAEWKVMSKIWSLEPVTIMQLTVALKEETGWDKSTVITLLKRMEAKKAVAYEKEERAKKYYSILKREDAELAETKSFLKRIYHGSIGLMVNSLITQKAISEDDLQELQNILNQAECDDDD